MYDERQFGVAVVLILTPCEQVHRCSQYNYAFTMKTFVIINGVVTLVEYIINTNA